jgi:hypothetical protein
MHDILVWPSQLILLVKAVFNFEDYSDFFRDRNWLAGKGLSFVVDNVTEM